MRVETPQPHVVNLVYREGLSSVFEAMVLAPLSQVAAQGVSTCLAIFSPVGEFFRTPLRDRWHDRMAAIRAKYAGRIERLMSPPARVPRLWNEARQLRRSIDRQIGRNDRLVLHCRGAQAANLAIDVRLQRPQTRVLFDMRGLLREEYLYEQGSSSIVARRLFELEQRAARQADAIVCVSSVMKEYAVGTFRIDPARITIIPCCVDTSAPDPRLNRHAVRDRLGLTDRYVVAFCGSSQRWQLPEESAELFKQIKRLQPSAHYLVLTSSPAKMLSLLERVGIDPADRTVLNVPHAQVSEHLAAADLGLLLRKPALINAVASPVKFGEYVASSLPVVISDGIGDFSEWVNSEKVGVVLNSTDNNETHVRQLREWLATWPENESAIRRRCMSLACDRLSLDMAAKSLIQIYQKLAAA